VPVAAVPVAAVPVAAVPVAAMPAAPVGRCLQAAMLPGKCCLPPCQCVALYQPVFWMLFTTIPLVLGALVEMPE